MTVTTPMPSSAITFPIYAAAAGAGRWRRHLESASESVALAQAARRIELSTRELTAMMNPTCRHCGGPINGNGECLEEIWNYTYRH